jgi:hypothetical protein
VSLKAPGRRRARRRPSNRGRIRRCNHATAGEAALDRGKAEGMVRRIARRKTVFGTASDMRLPDGAEDRFMECPARMAVACR